MPPPRKTLLPDANKIFVNREKPIAAFEDAAARIAPDSSSVLVFYGIGGQGKSSLARELRHKCELKDRTPYLNLRCAELDLHGRPNSDPEMLMVWLRNAFADAGVAAPCFDLTLGIQWAAQRPEQPLPELRSSWFTRESDVIGGTATDLLGIVKDLAGEEIAKIPMFGGLIRRASRWAIRKGYETYLHAAHGPLQELYRNGELKKPYEIAALLPWMLAQDLNNYLRRYSDERYVLFIDEYERVFAQGGAAESWSANPFDRNMRALIAETNGLLAVFFSRERLPWDEDPDWADTLAGCQHLLGGLTADDAHRYLRAIPVSDEALREAMIAGARETERADASIYPFMLDLQVEHWRQLVARKLPAGPESFGVSAPDFRGRRREIVERVLRDYDPALQATLRRLACARRFDRGAFDEVVSTFKTGLPGDSFEIIAQLSFASASDDGFVAIHSVMAEAIREMLEPERRVEAIDVLFKHYEARATVTSHFDVTDATIDALNEAAYLRRQQGIEGYAEWLHPISEPLAVAARYAASAELWREALIAIESALGPESRDMVECLNNLGGLSIAQGDYNGALGFYRRALGVSEKLNGKESAHTANVVSNVGGALVMLGDYAAAKECFEQALSVREKVQEPDHPELAINLNNLAGVLCDLGDYASARKLHERALVIREKAHGPEHTATATTLNNLGLTLEQLGDFSGAKQMHERALSIREKTLGQEHPVTAVSHNNLANVLAHLGDYATAKSLHERSVRIREKALGPDHPDTATSLNNLAHVLNQLGDRANARKLQERSVAINERTFGREHPTTAGSLSVLAQVLRADGELDAARALYEETLAIREKAFGSVHPQTSATLNSLAGILADLGEPDRAMSTYRRALEIAEKLFAPDHHAVARVVNNIAVLHYAQGARDEARPLFERALAATEKAYGIAHASTVKIARRLHKIAQEDGDTERARALLEKYGAGIAETPAPTTSA
jgi:tetratricopeptide (TPR) repeat protein